MRISDWSADVCSSDLLLVGRRADGPNASVAELCGESDPVDFIIQLALDSDFKQIFEQQISNRDFSQTYDALRHPATVIGASDAGAHVGQIASAELHTYLLAYWVRERGLFTLEQARSEEHTSELQSLMRISYAVFCLKKKTIKEHK